MAADVSRVETSLERRSVGNQYVAGPQIGMFAFKTRRRFQSDDWGLAETLRITVFLLMYVKGCILENLCIIKCRFN